MKKLITTLLLSLTILSSHGQTSYEPQILILSPNKTKFNKTFKKELDDYNKILKEKAPSTKIDDYINSPAFEKKPDNIKRMTKGEVEFSRNLDFFKLTGSVSEQYLVYKFFERFPNLLIILKDTKSEGKISNIRKIAEQEEIQYVINFPSIELYKQNGISYAKINVVLYDQVSNSNLINKSYAGNWNNPGFEFACKDSSIGCTINNALSQALTEIIYVISSNSPTLKKERELKQKRFDALINNYYSKSFDKSFLTNIIMPADSNIDAKALYQCLVDNTQNKFVAFFLNAAPSQDFKGLNDNNQDKNIKIETHYDIKDPGYLDDIPKTYAYIVKGIKYNEKWFYEKSEVTYFEAKDIEEGRQKYFNNLQKWNFFKDNSTDFNNEFWETKLFEKIQDKKKDPEWNKYGKTIWKTEEEENRDYIGQYEIIAKQIKKTKADSVERNRIKSPSEIAKVENDVYREKVKKEIFLPFFEKLKNKNPNEYKEYILNRGVDLTLIFPKDKNVILCIISFKNSSDEAYLKYFVVFPQKQTDFFEWTYLKPELLKDRTVYGKTVVNNISALTEWNYLYQTLDDKQFWDSYVLMKSGDSYKYLTPVK